MLYNHVDFLVTVTWQKLDLKSSKSLEACLWYMTKSSHLFNQDYFSAIYLYDENSTPYFLT